MAPKSRVLEPKPPTTLSTAVIIADNAVLTGTHPIRIGAHTVVHPRCRLNSTNGPITIGEFCILSERSVLVPADRHGLVVEDYVVIETNAVVEARVVGEGSMVEIGTRVGKAAVVGKVRFFSLSGEGGMGVEGGLRARHALHKFKLDSILRTNPPYIFIMMASYLTYYKKSTLLLLKAGNTLS